MTMLSTLCTKVNGRLKMFEKDVFDREFARFGDGEDLELTIESVGEKHTSAQRRFFHGPVLKAFMSMGMGKQEAKDMLALMFIPQEITMLDGSVMRVPGHTSALKKDAYSAFIEECIQCAAEQGQVVLDSEEWLRKNRRAQAKPLQADPDETTHFVPFDSVNVGWGRARALCGTLAAAARHSTAPTCKDCQQAQAHVEAMEF